MFHLRLIHPAPPCHAEFYINQDTMERRRIESGNMEVLLDGGKRKSDM